MNRIESNTDLVWRIRLFDGPVLEDASGNKVRRFRSQRTAALLAYLCLRLGRPCGREEVAAALWPECDDTQILANRLRFTLASLRRQLEPPGVPFGSVLDASVPGQICLSAETVWCDVDAAERALRSGDRAAARRMAGGVFLPNYYDDWILDARSRFEGLCDDPDEAALSDDLANATRPADTARPQTRPPARQPDGPNRRLPLYLTRFFGREAEREQLRDLIANNRLVTVTGLGGMGKTRVAVEALRSIELPCTFVPLAELAGDGLAEAALRAMLVAPQPAGDATAQLVAVLHRRGAFLLVLDNAEHIVDDVATFALRLLGEAPDLRLLVTSRQRLNVAGEAILPLDRLEAPRYSSSPERLLEFPAVGLFLDRARAARPDFQLADRHVGPLVEICRRLNGIPLALELAAARVASQSLAQIAESVAGSLMELSSHQHGLAARHRSLRAVLRGSYELLPREEQSFFVRLSVFRGGWTADAARCVCGDERAEELLASLIDRSLVTACENETSGDVRFGFLEPVREFAAAIADGSPDRAATVQRHAAYFLDLAEHTAPRLRAQAATAALDELEREGENIRASLQCAADAHDVDMLRRFAVALSPFWVTRGHYSDARHWYETLVAELVGGPPAAEAEARAGAAMFAVRQGNFAAARAHLARLMARCRDGSDDHGQMRGYVLTGDADRLQGDHAAAVEHYNAGLALCRTAGSQDDLARCHHGLGVTYWYQGNLSEARAHLETALRIRQAAGQTLDVARTQNLLAFTAREQGDEATAERLFRAALEVFTTFGERWYHASTLCGIGIILAERGETQRAIETMQEALLTAREIGSQMSAADIMVALGHLHIDGGEHAEASRTILESIDICCRMDSPQSLSDALICAVCLLAALGCTEAAAQILAVAMRMLSELRTRVINYTRRRLDGTREILRATLGPMAFEAALTAGSRLSLDEAVALARRQLAA